MTNDERALRAAILDNPADDAPRLIFADWLDEHGDHARAEFIRIQCELARITEESAPRRYELEKRETQFLRKHQTAWLRPYKLKPDQVTFRRGFIDRLDDAGNQTAMTLASLLANEPLRELDWRSGSSEPLFTSPRMAHITSLDCSSVSLPATEVATLLNRPCWQRLRALNLGWCALPEEPSLPELLKTTLAFVEEVDFCGVEGLTASVRRSLYPALANLKKLSFGYTDLGDRELAEFASRRYPRLEYLDLGAENYTLAGFADLLARAKMPALKTLRVFANNLTNTGGLAFAEQAPWPTLEEFDAGNCGFGTMAARALARSPRLPNLRRLHLGNELSNHPNKIGDLGLKALVESPHFPKLRELDVLFNNITAKGVGFLVSKPLLQQLWKLNLNNNPIGDAGVELLAQCPAIGSLRMVGLLDCGLTDTGAEALLNSPYWSKHVRINLDQNEVSPALMKKVARRFAKVPTNRFACSFAAP